MDIFVAQQQKMFHMQDAQKTQKEPWYYSTTFKGKKETFLTNPENNQDFIN